MKTGSSSVNEKLSEINDPDIKIFKYDKTGRHIPDNCNKKYFKHTSCNELTEKHYDDYFKFAFVRNPWDRVVSWFGFGKKVHRDDLNIKNETFDNFILNKSKSHRWGGDNQHQHNFTNCCDFIGRFENLQEDFNTICGKIGIPQQKLPHQNKSKHKYYTEYYDEKTKQIVAEVFAKDIEHFGYKFGE